MCLLERVGGAVTFKDYIVQRPAGYDAVGDFVRVARGDNAFPDVRSLDELTAHLAARREYQAFEVARQLWVDYQRLLQERARRARKTQVLTARLDMPH